MSNDYECRVRICGEVICKNPVWLTAVKTFIALMFDVVVKKHSFCDAEFGINAFTLLPDATVVMYLWLVKSYKIACDEPRFTFWISKNVLRLEELSTKKRCSELFRKSGICGYFKYR